MPNYTRTISVKISKKELESILRQHLNVPSSAKVSFNLGYTSSYDDRYSDKVFESATVEYVEEQKTTEPYERGF